MQVLRNTTIPIIQQAVAHDVRTAIVDSEGEHTYRKLVSAAEHVASGLLDGKADLGEARVAFLVPSSFGYAAVQWGIWLAGGIAIPLCTDHPAAELKYVLQDSGAGQVISAPDFEDKVRPLAVAQKARFLLTSDVLASGIGHLPDIDAERRAMILYTSGTTNKPKGAVLTHENVTAQITCLIEAWEWTVSDRILQILPLHHVHGIINVLSCALWSGATCEMLPEFNATRVLDRFSEGGLTLFMAVPTIYVKLIRAWNEAGEVQRKRISHRCAAMRLMVSGSAALPVSVLEEWESISGHILLERYGMTETGMALSNPLHGERRPGFVGTPLPRVEARIVDESNEEITREGEQGEIQVRGPGIFREYWGKPEATHEAFRDGWFLTGDVAIIEKGYFRILGRNSVDIIKSGGYKISALEIEEVLRTHPGIHECAVVGVEDEEWGERVSAAVVLNVGFSLSLAELRNWAQDELAKYKIPSRILVMDELPRNVMGKVTKPAVKRLFEAEETT